MEIWHLDKYLRHQSIHWLNQKELLKKNVLIVGVGAIGNELLKNMILMGIGNIFVVDRDIIEIHNLTRSVFFSEEDIGKSKAEVAAKKAKKMNSDCNIDFYKGNIEDICNFSFLKQYDAVFSALDNFSSRIFLHQMCYLEKIDFFNAGIDSQYISLEYFPYSRYREICFECYLPNKVYENINQRYSCGWVLKSAYQERKIPTTILTASFAGSGLLSLYLRKENFDYPVKILLDSIYWNFSYIELKKKKECHFCSQFENYEEYQWNDFLREYKLEELSLMINEPILAYLECECGYFVELWDLSRKYNDKILKCPRCGGEKSIKAHISDIFSFQEIEQLNNIPFKYAISSLKNKTILIKK